MAAILDLYPEKVKGGKGGGKPDGPPGLNKVSFITISDYDAIVLPPDLPEPATLLLIVPGLLLLARRKQHG